MPRGRSKARQGKTAVPTLVVRRLQRDLAELQREELTTVAACPSDDLLKWHVNITAPEGPFCGYYIHCIMEFPSTYPSDPPTVRCMTHFPHPNIFDEEICLNMLKEYHPDKFEGWSSAYSVTSILYQLQSFFFADSIRQEYGDNEMAETTGMAMKHVVDPLLNFSCKECGHTGKSPYPAPITRCAPRKDNNRPRDMFNRWTDLPRDCCFVFLQYLDSVSLYCASWATREWYHVFDTYSLGARHNIRCFHTKMSHEEDGVILGFGFRRLEGMGGGMGMMTSQMDYLSNIAWNANVRQDMWRSPLDVFIPLILNSSHGKRAYPLLLKQLKDVNDQSPVFAIVKMMNDIVVALAKHCTAAFESKTYSVAKCRYCAQPVEEGWRACPSCGESVDYGFIGISATEELMEVAMSEKALLGYSSLHQILLYLVETDNECDRTARSIVEKLRRGRVAKGQTRDLGQALIIMSCVDGISWRDVSKKFLMESWIRKVKWFVKRDDDWNNPSVENYRDIFEATRVSMCVIMFQVKFLSFVDGTRRDCLARYNRRLGRPSQEMTARLNDFCREMVGMMKCDRFEEQYAFYWSTVGMRCPSGSEFIYLLRDAVRVSAERRYHHTAESPDVYDWTTPDRFSVETCLRFNRKSRNRRRHVDEFVPPNPAKILKQKKRKTNIKKAVQSRTPKFQEAFFAARKGDVDALTALLRKNDREKVFGMTDLHGRTLLHFGVAGQHVEVVRFLLEFGADPNALDNSRQSPLSLARQFENEEVRCLVEDAVSGTEQSGTPSVISTEEEEKAHNDFRFAVIEIRGLPLQMASREKILKMVRGVGIRPKSNRQVNLTHHSARQLATATVSVNVEDKLLSKVKKLNQFIVQGSKLSAHILRRKYRGEGDVKRTPVLFCTGFAKFKKLSLFLEKMFSPFGQLCEAPSVTTDRNGRPIAFITFVNAACAERARNELNGVFRLGGFLSIHFKSDKRSGERNSGRRNGRGRSRGRGRQARN